MKYYSVRVGRNPGIYESWDECFEQVHGFKNAEFKSFKTLNEAQDYLKIKAYEKNKITKSSKTEKTKKPNYNNLTTDSKNLDDECTIIAYSDGSYLKSDKTYSYGAVVLWKDKEYHFSKRFKDVEDSSMWNVSGELEGAKRVMLFAYANKIPNLWLHHDYEGIAKWANNEWKAQKQEAIDYVRFVKKIKQKVKIKFIWVKGHSGNEYNEKADQLAAKAKFKEEVLEVKRA